jgi:hypothetical protein
MALWATRGAARLGHRLSVWLAGRPWKYGKGLALTVAAVLALVLIFGGYFRLPATGLYFLVDDENLAALQWFRNQADLCGLKVVADPDVGTIVTPLTRLVSKVTFRTGQNVSAAVGIGTVPRSLGEGACEEKLSYLTRMGADIVYTRNAQSCHF